MSEFRFVNGAPRKMLLVIEPSSSEFWIKSKATVQVLVEDADQGLALDVEYLPNGLVIYVEQGRQVEVRQDGRLLGLDKRSRGLGHRLNREGEKAGERGYDEVQAASDKGKNPPRLSGEGTWR